MSEYSDQLAVIHTTVSAVTDIGRVYDRPRYGDAEQMWIVEIGGIPLIRAWQIGVNGETVTDRLTQGHRSRFRPWRIQGYVGPIDVDDADPSVPEHDPSMNQITPGYKAALSLTEAVADAIEANRTLSGTCLDLADPGSDQIGTRITEPGVIMIPGPLCWGVGVEFWTWTHPA